MFTMVVRMLGYDIDVEGIGNWPDNYIAKAKDLNLIENLDSFNAKDGSNRGSVAQVLYNGIENVYTRDEYVLVKTFNTLFDAYTGKTSKENLISMCTNGKNSIKTNLKFNLNVYKNTEFYKELDEEDIKELNLYNNVINNLKLNVELDFDLLQEYIQSILKYTYKDEELLQVQYSIDKENVYMSLNDVFDGNYKIVEKVPTIDRILYEIKDDIFDEILDEMFDEINNDSVLYWNYQEFETISSKEIALVKRIIFNEMMNLSLKREKTIININGKNENVIRIPIMLNQENVVNCQKNLLLSIRNDNELLEEKLINSGWSIDEAKEKIDEAKEILDDQIERCSNMKIDNQEKYNTFTVYMENNSNSLVGLDINMKDYIIEYRVKGEDYIQLQINFIEPYNLEVNNICLEMIKTNEDKYDCKLNIKYCDYNDKEIASFDVYGDIELSNKVITKSDFSNSFEKIDEETQEKINSKIKEVVTKIGLEQQYEKYIEMQKRVMYGAKRAMFMNNVNTMQDAVTLARLNNYMNMYGANKTINNKYYNIIDGVNKEDTDLSNAKVLGSIKVVEYEASEPVYENVVEITNNQQYITKDITLYKISDSMKENSSSINILDFGVDRNGTAYYYKGIIIDGDTYYNNSSYIKGKANGAVDINDYRY